MCEFNDTIRFDTLALLMTVSVFTYHLYTLPDGTPDCSQRNGDEKRRSQPFPEALIHVSDLRDTIRDPIFYVLLKNDINSISKSEVFFLKGQLEESTQRHSRFTLLPSPVVTEPEWVSGDQMTLLSW